MSTRKAARSKAKPARSGTKKARKKPSPKRTATPARKASKAAAPTSSGMDAIGLFNWNELMTSDAAAATSFYTRLLGWTSKPFGEGGDYTILENGSKSAGGLLQTPESGPPPMWIPYVTVKDINATISRLNALGGRVCKPPFAVPTVGHIAIVQDPQGAMFGLHSS